MITLLVTLFGAQKQKMDERGASAVEYGLLIAGIAALIVVVVFTLGGTVQGAFTNTNSSITNGSGAGGTGTTTP
ncbi:unannotated protein [freshwater metagenome]|uniref:Unannotated protein n=1 Tax=freshwater metagenome TaxID=449393 RepID=A0A6J6US84_9ZZZZ|nr:Flp family type IVb pilin [Actinomycetota bacterium]